MANWVTHLAVTDKLYEMGINLDERGFAVGNIAPDCNVEENEEWTKFNPPREITHWMNGDSKLTADYESFYEACIKDKEFISNEKRAFFWGYYSHLITDVEMQKFFRDEERVKEIYLRIKQNDKMYGRIKNMPENYDTLKEVFGRNNFAAAFIVPETEYLRKNPNSRYNTIIKETHCFPDYIDYLPHGAIVRKIVIMPGGYRPGMLVNEMQEYIYFNQNEFNSFIENTSSLVYKLMRKKRYTTRKNKHDI